MGLACSALVSLLRRWFAAECGQKFFAVRASQTRAGIPSGCGRITIVVSRHNIVERRSRAVGVQQRIEKPNGFTKRLIEKRSEPGPERRHRAGASDHRPRSIHDDVIASCRIGIARDIGDATPRLLIRRLWYIGVLLPGR